MCQQQFNVARSDVVLERAPRKAAIVWPTRPYSRRVRPHPRAGGPARRRAVVDNGPKSAIHHAADVPVILVYAVIGDAVLRKVIRANFFRAIAGADLACVATRSLLLSRRWRSYRSERSIAMAFSRFCVCDRSCCDATMMPLGTCVIRIGRFRLIDVLTAGARGLIRIDLQVGRLDLDIDVFIDLGNTATVAVEV